MKGNVEIVQELLKGATKPDVVAALVADDAVYMSLTYDNPELKKLMPWAGRHKDGKAAILKTFSDVNRYWTVEKFDVQQIFGQGDYVAVFGSFTLRSTKLGKRFTSPFSILATLRNGKVTYMQYMEDTFGTGSTFRSGGKWIFSSDPAGGEVEV
ncbi:MAG TPA: nuclear transport factor 2 family protein [Phycisphaerae bacterium]|nr:nuclear transport factor 2 family protein [Phycisphaerae bacterium]